MQEAGYGQGLKGLDFVVREANTFKLWAVAIQAMLKEHLNIECNLRMVQISQWFDEAAAGNFDLAISAIVSTLMDPSDYFTAWYGKDGPQNYAGWTNEQFHSLVRQIDRELDENKRKATDPPGRADPRAGSRRSSRSPTSRSTTPGTTGCAGRTRRSTSASTTWSAGIRSRWPRDRTTPSPADGGRQRA